ncbi:MAG: exonuclease [Chitinophagaceae bacterium]|nr:exonuclease [Chitinophagaceae bacterium]HMN33321.1 exonuclease domain-containing protein [Chitinophagaceae bacterium]
MYAVIDIETTGPKFDIKTGRIIDICIVIFDGEKICDQFSTLINPECQIEPFYTKLTGITNEMVEDAPKFHEVAKKIVEITEGKIFVAHNVSFDFRFIQDEFASLGYFYTREKICTVQLSRHLIPDKKSYSLGKLCDSLGIKIRNRHRAEGDAIATTYLLQLLLQKAPTPIPLYTPQVKKSILQWLQIIRQLPTSTGVYYCLDKQQQIIYIGHSKNIRSNAVRFFKSQFKKINILKTLSSVDYIETGSEIISQLIEVTEIKKHNPILNQQAFDMQTDFCIDMIKRDADYYLQIVPIKESEFWIESFSSYRLALQALQKWVRDYSLSLKYCILSENEVEVFVQQEKEKNEQSECIEIHTEKIEKLIQEKLYPFKNFVIYDKGRTKMETSFILIENYHYVGYGYVNKISGEYRMDELKKHIVGFSSHFETDRILKAYLPKAQRMIKILEK